MKVIIAGGRKITDAQHVEAAVAASQFCITEVVSGRAPGVDRLGEEWAAARGIPVQPFPVSEREWTDDPHGAGHARNEKMACYADALVAVWDGESGGTRDMIRRARAHGLLVYVYRIPLQEPALPDFTTQEFS